jgi:hypothetical protein
MQHVLIPSSQEDWILVADSPDLNKSKLERFLGHGADSAHLVLNTEYRRRYVFHRIECLYSR